MAHLTKKAIQHAFIRLLEEKSFDKITVKDIVETCEINRNTFYYYYEDIYDLLREVLAVETETILGKHQSFASWEDGVVEGIRFALDHRTALNHIYHSVNREYLERYLNQVIGYIMRDFVTQEAEGLKVSEADLDLVARFYANAVVGAVISWIQNDMKSDPEAEVRRIGELVEGSIRMALERAATE